MENKTDNPLACGTYQFVSRKFTRTTFRNVCLGEAVFDDVNLSKSNVHNVNMSEMIIDNVNLAGTRITNANYDGMTLDGILVTDLLRMYRENRK